MDSVRFRFDRQTDGDDGGAGEDDGISRGRQQLDEDEELELEVPCFLDIYVHHACNIHNICGIYGNHDVYAKFTLTSAPDDAPALSTRVAAGGGASPSFDERLPPLRVRRGRLGVDVLKCEVWMRRSGAKTTRLLLEDQFLGFALVPLADVAAAGGAMIGRDVELSSTDLFHSPAGTIRLSLALHSGIPGADACPQLLPSETTASITSEVVILDASTCRRIVEFPDLNMAKAENINHDDTAVQYQYLPFLQLGEGSDAMEMSPSPSRAINNNGENISDLASSSTTDGSKNASTTTTASDDRVTTTTTSSSAVNKATTETEKHESTAAMCSPETPTSSNGKTEKADDVFTSPLGGVVDGMDAAEQSEMQRWIMEMYARSMQQFSESLATLKMPIQEEEAETKAETTNVTVKQRPVKNDGARVFYGSRAFF